MGSSDKDQGKKKVTEVKTFLVPFALEEIKENITINTNAPSKPSKEQIINQAIQFHLKGNIQEAAKLYQYCINQGFKDHRVFCNYGAILQGLGKLEEAEISTRKAIEIKPDFAEAHYNLGNTLKNLGNLEDAELSILEAIKIGQFSDEYSFYDFLGNLYRDRGELDKSIKSFEEMPDSISKIRLSKLIGLSINYVIQGYVDKALINIKEANLFIDPKVLSSYKNNQKASSNYTWYIYLSNLINKLKKNNHKDSDYKVLHIGDSHSISFTHQNINLLSKPTYIQPVLILGGKAWHFANKKNNRFKSSLKEQVKNHTDSDQIFISFGDIDCRKNEGIIFYAMKYKEDILGVAKNTVNQYVDYMESTLDSLYSTRYYFGFPAPMAEKECLSELDIIRNKLVKSFNFFLKEKVLSRGSFFVDVYELTANKDGYNNCVHMCDSTHLSPICLPILFENHLYKP